MTFEFIADIWNKKLDLEQKGEGYSSYGANLTDEEVKALTHVDALSVGLAVRKERSELKSGEEEAIKGNIVVIKNSKHWLSATGKLSHSKKVREILSQRLED